MNTYSITDIIAAAKKTNNGRLTGLNITEPQKRAAEKAVARGLLTKYHMNFPGFGFTVVYALASPT